MVWTRVPCEFTHSLYSAASLGHALSVKILEGATEEKKRGEEEMEDAGEASGGQKKTQIETDSANRRSEGRTVTHLSLATLL